MRTSNVRISAIAGCAATCATLAFTSIGVPPAQHPRIAQTSVQLQAASVGTPEEILTALGNAAVAIVGAAAWFAAFPITIPASVGFALWADTFRNAGFPTLRLDELIGSGLQVFVSLPTNSVQNAFTQLGQSLGLISPQVASAAAGETAAITYPVDIMNRTADVVRTVAQAAFWFAAFPITLPKSLILGLWASVYASGINNWATQIPLIDALGIGLTSFFETPLKPVRDAFAGLGLALGITTAPAAAAALPTAATRTTPTKLPRAATTARATRKAEAAVAQPVKRTKHSAAQRRQATPR